MSRQFELVFLGFAERASCVADFWPPGRYNLIGLRAAWLAYYFPTSLAGAFVCFAFRGGRPRQNKLTAEILHGEDCYGAITLELLSEGDAAQREGPFDDLWTVLSAQLPDSSGLILTKPGSYRLIVVDDDGCKKDIGQFQCHVVDPCPLNVERIAAIRSDPHAAKAVRIQLGCQHCDSTMKVYAALDRGDNFEMEGYRWFADLPERFECSCGKTSYDLDTMRKNLHGHIGTVKQYTLEANLVPLYNRDNILDICRKFVKCIDKNPKEEIIQIFIKDNPVLLHQFPASRIILKPKILTFHTADFGILSHQKELILVEIERADTRILTSSGGVASQLTHAFDQVREWMHVADNHRLALLASLSIKPEEVSNIRGVVIAGRDKGQNQDHMSKLRSGLNRERITFLTFDDLVSNLSTLAASVSGQQVTM